MKEIIAQYTVDLLEMIKTGANFVIGEMPKIAEEIIKFCIYKDVFYILTFLFIVLVFVGLAFLSDFVFKKQKAEELYRNDDDYWSWWCRGVAVVVAVVFFISFIIILPYNILDIIKAQTAPRLYLIEYLSGLLK